MTNKQSTKRLYKSRSERMIDGVCGGIAEYFALDPTLIRVAWVLLTLLGGSGIILYIIAIIVMPKAPLTAEFIEQSPSRKSNSNDKFWGLLLVTVGIVWLMSNLGFAFWHHWWGISWQIVFAVLLILAGVAFLFGGRNSLTNSSSTSSPEMAEEGVSSDMPGSLDVKRLYKSRTDKKLFGICGGIAEHLNLDSTIVRLIFVAAALASFGLAAVVYIVMVIVVPDEPITFPAT